MALSANPVNYFPLNGTPQDFASNELSYTTGNNFFRYAGIINGGIDTGLGMRIATYNNATSYQSQPKVSTSCWFRSSLNSATAQELANIRAVSNGMFDVQLVSGAVRFSIFNTPTEVVTNYVTTTANNFTNGYWHHVVCVFDGTLTGNTNRAKVYIDGVLQATTATGTIPAATNTATAAINMAQLYNNTQSLFGELCEIGLWQAALTSLDVAELYNNGAGLLYPFDGSIYPNWQAYQFSNWLLGQWYKHITPSRLAVITAINTAAKSGTSVSANEWRNFLIATSRFTVQWQSYQSMQ